MSTTAKVDKSVNIQEHWLEPNHKLLIPNCFLTSQRPGTHGTGILTPSTGLVQPLQRRSWEHAVAVLPRGLGWGAQPTAHFKITPTAENVPMQKRRACRSFFPTMLNNIWQHYTTPGNLIQKPRFAFLQLLGSSLRPDTYGFSFNTHHSPLCSVARKKDKYVIVPSSLWSRTTYYYHLQHFKTRSVHISDILLD